MPLKKLQARNKKQATNRNVEVALRGMWTRCTKTLRYGPSVQPGHGFCRPSGPDRSWHVDCIAQLLVNEDCDSPDCARPLLAKKQPRRHLAEQARRSRDACGPQSDCRRMGPADDATIRSIGPKSFSLQRANPNLREPVIAHDRRGAIAYL